MMDIFTKIQDSLKKYSNNNAFFIDNNFFSYHELAFVISKIRKLIKEQTKKHEKIIGLVANDDIETYSAIIALWLEGRAYVPLSTNNPINRNKNIISQAEIITVLDSKINSIYGFQTVNISELNETKIDLKPKKVPDDELAYMIFTSGTTGIPKGVPISRRNLKGIINALNHMNFDINENDRCLQMSELTFDVSITSFLYPLLKGACIYTIPKDVVKYTYIYDLLENHNLTIAQLVPSLLNYLRKYFNEIYLPDLKYSLITAEALSENLAKEWSKCTPNAKIFNLYGPTENTVWSTYYEFSNFKNNESVNGILSIGKAMIGSEIIIVDKKNQILTFGEKGELCISGIQLTTNYWKNEKQNKKSFFYLNYKNKKTRFYRTGDLCSYAKTGNILYLGRIDLQAKIQGFRVELSEIEYHVKSFLKKINVVAVEISNITSHNEIGLALESDNFNCQNLLKHLKTKMPKYMVPKKIIFLEKIPLNSNGKINRKKIKSIFESSLND